MSHRELLGYDNIETNQSDQSLQDIAAYQAAVYNNQSLLLQAE